MSRAGGRRGVSFRAFYNRDAMQGRGSVPSRSSGALHAFGKRAGTEPGPYIKSLL